MAVQNPWEGTLARALTADQSSDDPMGVADGSGTWAQLASAPSLQEQIQRWAQNSDMPAFPIAVKANIAVRGLVQSAGTPALAATPSRVDAGIVMALRARGGVVAGTANMHELALGITSNNSFLGPVRHPDHARYSAGGSSGGSAAAVARGQVPIALGTDTGGSISIPAAVCGTTGFRPTTGRWPHDGVAGLSWTRDTPGVLTSAAAAAAQVDRWVTGAKPGSTPERPRLGVVREFRDDLTPEVATAFDAAATTIASGNELVEVSLRPVLEQIAECEWQIVAFEAPRLLTASTAAALGLDHEQAWETLLKQIQSPDVMAILQEIASDPVSAETYDRARARMWQARHQYRTILEAAAVDALIYPTTPRTATPLGVDGLIDHGGRDVPVFALMTRHTLPATLLQAPMVTLPLPVPAGAFPVGLTIQGHAHDDAAVLALGQELQARLGI